MIHNFITEHITGDRIKGCSQIHYEFGHNPSHDRMIQRAKIIYVKTDYILDVFKYIINRERPVIVITHNSDYNVTEKWFSKKPKCVKRWYAQNVAVKDDILIPVPIGCENVNTPKGYSGDMTVINKATKLSNNKKWLCYMNFNMRNNVNSRVDAFEYFYGKPWVLYERYGVPFEHCMTLTAQSKFVVCPEGNGIDTHRVWEALYLGAIPIVKKNIHFSSFNELPIVTVDSWEQVTESFLVKWWSKFDKKNYNLEKMKMSYWKTRIKRDV